MPAPARRDHERKAKRGRKELGSLGLLRAAWDREGQVVFHRAAEEKVADINSRGIANRAVSTKRARIPGSNFAKYAPQKSSGWVSTIQMVEGHLLTRPPYRA